MAVSQAFQPIFTTSDPLLPGGNTGPQAALTRTYRYLRLGMVTVVVGLGYAVWTEHRKAPHGCFQDSISAYYYTPVRPVFVGGMVAIGVSLIVIKGRTGAEDFCLSLAGGLAAVVAFVPTTNAGTCSSVTPESSPLASGHTLQPWVTASIHNNLGALLFAGSFGLGLAVVLFSVRRGRVRAVFEPGSAGTRIGFLATLIFLVAGGVALRWWTGIGFDLHAGAAVAMFVALALAALENGYREHFGGTASAYRGWYRLVALAMAGVVVVIPVSKLLIPAWDHWVLFIEASEILLFVGFWVIQTRERWDSVV